MCDAKQHLSHALGKTTKRNYCIIFVIILLLACASTNNTKYSKRSICKVMPVNIAFMLNGQRIERQQEKVASKNS